MNDKLYNMRKLHQQRKAELDAKAISKIQIPTKDQIKDNIWKSASDVARNIGTDKVFKSKFEHDVKWCGSDYSDGYTISGNIFFYARDIEDAKEKLQLFKDIHNKFGIHYAMSLSDTGHNYYEFSEPVETTISEALAAINKYIASNGTNTTSISDFQDHILALPTKKMYDEMKKSIDWAVNILSKMRDQDMAQKKEAWLNTPEGRQWKAQFDEEKRLLDKLEDKEHQKAIERQNKQNIQDANVKMIEDIERGLSEKYPDRIAPVEVVGGRKFKGKGFVIAIQPRDNGDLYYGGDCDEWDEAIIYDPISEKIQHSNLKFCRLDDSVTNEQCKEAFQQYCDKTVKKTLDWCKQKDPNKSQYELQRWAKNIIKKYHPQIDVDKYIKFDAKDMQNAEANKVFSTVDWAIGLHKGQSETERIIMKALSKKGIDYKNFKSIIMMKLNLAYGRNPKIMTFN